LSPFIRAQSVQSGDRLLAWSVFCCLLAFYLATFAGLPDNPDAEVEFQTTSALVRNQSFALGGTPEAEAIVGIVHQGRQGFNVARGGPGREQEFFSWSGIGQPLVAFPLYVAGSFLGRMLPAFEERHRATTHLGAGRSEYFEHLVVGLRNPLLGALTGALIVITARRAGARRLHAAMAGLTYGLASYAWPQARGTLSDVQASAALFLAFVLTQGVSERLERGKPARAGAALGFGMALGVAFLTRTVLAPAVAVLGIYYLVRCVRAARELPPGRFPLRELVLGYTPALLCFGLYLWTNERRFGDPLESGYGGVVGLSWFLRSPLEGLVGVTVSPGSGLLWFTPLVLLTGVWWVSALRRGERGVPLLVLALLFALGVPHVLIPSWHGAWSYGPRYILPLLPFLWFPLGVAFGILSERLLGRIAVLALTLLGSITALGGVLVEYNTNLDLSFQAARVAWPTVGEITDPAVADEERFLRTKFDWRFAAPWAHWRIFRHRMAGMGESYSVRELYYLADDTRIEPAVERTKGFRHLAWVDLAQRLGGPTWIGPLLVVLLGIASFALALRASEADLA